MSDAHPEQNDDTVAAAEPSAPEVVAGFSADEHAAVTEHAAELKIPLTAYVRQSAAKRAQE